MDTSRFTLIIWNYEFGDAIYLWTVSQHSYEKRWSGEVYLWFVSFFAFDHNQIFFCMSFPPMKTVSSLGTVYDLLFFMSSKIWRTYNIYSTSICWKEMWVVKEWILYIPSFAQTYLSLSCKPGFPFPNENSVVNVGKPRQMEIKLVPNISGDYKALCDAFSHFIFQLNFHLESSIPRMALASDRYQLGEFCHL